MINDDDKASHPLYEGKHGIHAEERAESSLESVRHPQPEVSALVFMVNIWLMLSGGKAPQPVLEMSDRTGCSSPAGISTAAFRML